MGAASDSYAGWLGQVYTEERYQGRQTQRTKMVGDQVFIEEVLQLDSVVEYFELFPVLEIDFTFYSRLKDLDGKPTQSFQFFRATRSICMKATPFSLKWPR